MKNKKKDKSTLIMLVCAVCGSEFSFEPEKIKEQYAQVVLQAGTMTAIQVRILCPQCRSKDLKDRVIKK